MTNPRLRFKKPDGAAYPDWEKTTVGTLFAPVCEKNRNDAFDNVITNSAEYGLIPQRDFFDKDIAVEGRTSNYTIIHKGDFVYNPRKSTTAPFGPFNCYELEEPGIVSPLYTCLKPKDDTLSNYLLWYFQTYKWHPYIKQNGAQGGARHDRVGMTSELMAGIPVSMPKSDGERERIVHCLESLNDRFVTQEQYVATLETQKKELLRQVFAREIRFKDGNGQDYPEWKNVILHDISEMITVGIANSATHAYREKGIVMFRNQNIKNNKLDDTDLIYIDEDFERQYKNKRLKAYDLLVARTGYPGTCCVVPPKYENTQTFTTIIVRLRLLDAAPQFICQYINSPMGVSYIASTQIGGGQKNSGVGIIEKMPVVLPSKPEQQRIADFFTALDAQIENERALLEDWRQLKKGLLQQMFV